jgi:hypothetical protein
MQRVDRDEGIKTREIVKAQDREIQGLWKKWTDFAKAKKGFIATAIITLIGSISMIAGAVAYATNLGANQRHETEMRAVQFQQLNKTIQELKTSIDKSNGHASGDR